MTEVHFPASFKAGLSHITFGLIVVFFVFLINIEYSALGLSEPFFPVTDQVKTFNDVIFWVIVGLLGLELVVAYLEIRDAKYFLKKYWLEIILLVLMPIFVGFKALKITIKIVKQIKVSKTGFKIFQKLKKSKKK
ncbi:hypothetical protein C6988_09640 [Nitrosopumilus sp. b1]|uniref:hypothetical protein n=1 Tax=Nitrosopumilus sp. b1 TaxID=2109907 RepID=UPI0015F69E6E|nr:hypothetical protein [Nitrosopumilus sp. b1]KAF6242200.1 hypothetical protein C6988_09640 [Nitrosopumilus sp. b1]